jgi:phage protein D
MSLHPVFKVQVGSSSLETAGSEVIDIAIRMSMDSAPGHFESSIKLGEKAASLAKDDKVIVSLGYDKNGTRNLGIVFTGLVESISSTGPKVMVMSPLTKLYGLRIDRFYNNQYAGDIVKDLAKEAGIQTDSVSNGIKFPSYVINRQKTCFEHVAELAKLCGFDFYPTSDGKIDFKEYTPSSSHVLQYGKNILEIQLVDHAPPADSVRVAGSSPSGTKGDDKHFWMTKKSVEDQVGSGTNQMLIQNSALKDPTTAKLVAEAVLKKLKAGITVNVKLLGNEKIRLGETIKIQNVPQSSLNGEFQVREIEHVLTSSEGFTTTITCRGGAAS